MSNPEDIGKAFLQHYYNLFDGPERQSLMNLYQDHSMFTFEGDKLQGRNNIMQKLLSLGHVKHNINTMDAQPTVGGGIIVFVSGKLQIDSNQPLQFSQVFSLMPVQGTAGFFVLNDVFRLVYC